MQVGAVQKLARVAQLKHLLQVNDQNLTLLSQVLEQTLSPDKATRLQGEKFLENAEAQQGYSILLLVYVGTNAGVQPMDKAKRQQAAITFKNFVKRNWSEEEAAEGNKKFVPIQQGDKDQIKAKIVDLMCSVPQNEQRQLSDSLTTICKYDFPQLWPQLLPELVNKFNTQDFDVINGVLMTANSIFKRFRYVYKTDALFAVLAECLAKFQQPLLDLFKATGNGIAAQQGNQPLLVKMFRALQLMARIFYSLNWQDLPEFFEDHMDEWMAEFGKYLSYSLLIAY
jgi:exportin-2 (importin alpha re-exporter)